MVSSLAPSAEKIPARFRSYFEKAPLLALVGNTPIVEVTLFKKELPRCKFLAKVESVNPGGSIKDRPVRRMLLEALSEGKLGPGKTIIDSSSGNAGIAYAMLGAALGQPVELVVPGNASLERKKRIKAHGARLVETDPIEGYDAALREAHRRYDEHPDRYFMPDQYKNSNNWRAHYEETAAEILAQTEGKLTHFVAGVGTGGTITGCGRRLKEAVPGVKVVMVRPDTFPGIEGLKPLDEPGSIIPEIFDSSVVDEKVRVTIEDAYDLCGRIAREMGLFVGQSSGAYLKAAYEAAKAEGSGTFVTIFSDLGERYFSTRLWD
ncbi:cysteine synthase family protein [bacterium]|nr:cysteine synthase family protein [bacterium]